MKRCLILCLIVMCLLVLQVAMAEETKPTYKGSAVSMHGDLKYKDAKYFEYVIVDVPSRINLGSQSVFDSFHPFITKGDSAPGIGLTFSRLMEKSEDEPFSLYGNIAEEIEFPEDRSWVIFYLRKGVTFHDGHSLTAEDVVWTMNILKEKGKPFYGGYYKDAISSEVIDDHTVKFTFAVSGNGELPLIVAELQVLPKHFFEGREFDESSLDIIPGTGPYKVKEFEAGKYVIYERVTGWWGADLLPNKGLYNFDEISYKVYMDETVMFEAFKSGELDVRPENSSTRWNTGYPDKEGMMKQEFPHARCAGMQAFLYNMRNLLFQDPLVRKALSYAFDFEWTNQSMMFSAYVRSDSFFSNSEMAAVGLPSEEELAILEQYKGKIPEEVFGNAVLAPRTDGTGNIRPNLQLAFNLLRQAGWEVNSEGKLEKDGEIFEFEILLYSKGFERIALPFAQNLERLGITVTIKTIDIPSYIKRLYNQDEPDFDMIVGGFGQSQSPGNEQRGFWTSASADIPGTDNLTGLKNPVVDEIVEKLILAKSREELVLYCRVLDRILRSLYIVIPQWHYNKDRLAWWDKFEIPETTPLYGVNIHAWRYRR